MRKVIYSMLVSVDGFIETTSGDLGWTNPDAELHQHFNDEDRAVDVFRPGFGHRREHRPVSGIDDVDGPPG